MRMQPPGSPAVISFRKCRQASGVQAERAGVVSAFFLSAGSACPPHSSPRPVTSRRRSHMHTASRSRFQALHAHDALQPYSACGSMYLQNITSTETRPPTALTPSHHHTHKSKNQHKCHTCRIQRLTKSATVGILPTCASNPVVCLLPSPIRTRQKREGPLANVSGCRCNVLNGVR